MPKINTENININNTFLRFTTICVVAAAVRYFLLFSKYQSIISNHIEVSTPINSWKRVSEGLYLYKNNINPYDGDLLHETPLSLLFYKTLLGLFNNCVELIFLLFDIFTGILLFFTTRRYIAQLINEQKLKKDKYAKDAKEYIITVSDLVKSSNYVLTAFLFNPYTIFNCVGVSTTVFHNFFLSVFFCSMVHGYVLISSISLAICTSISLYPFVLVIPLALYFKNTHKSILKTLLSVVFYIVTLVLIFLYCSNYGKDFKFMKNVYGFILTVPDLQPNIGLFWYFFTEMFDHFRELFICSFQINATILYLVPLSIKFRKQPFLLAAAELFLVCVFKSYPCVGDVGFVFSLLPCFIYLFPFCQQGFLVSVILLVTTALAPILWYLWIYCNSANANFYFGVTLAFAIAQIFLITDVLFAQVKREFCMINGKKREINGEEALLTLK